MAILQRRVGAGARPVRLALPLRSAVAKTATATAGASLRRLGRRRWHANARMEGMGWAARWPVACGGGDGRSSGTCMGGRAAVDVLAVPRRREGGGGGAGSRIVGVAGCHEPCRPANQWQGARPSVLGCTPEGGGGTPAWHFFSSRRCSPSLTMFTAENGEGATGPA